MRSLTYIDRNARRGTEPSSSKAADWRENDPGIAQLRQSTRTGVGNPNIAQCVDGNGARKRQTAVGEIRAGRNTTGRCQFRDAIVPLVGHPGIT